MSRWLARSRILGAERPSPPTWSCARRYSPPARPDIPRDVELFRRDKSGYSTVMWGAGNATPQEIELWITEVLGSALGRTLMRLHPLPESHPFQGSRIVLTFLLPTPIRQLAAYLAGQAAHAEAEASAAPKKPAPRVLAATSMSPPEPTSPSTSSSAPSTHLSDQLQPILDPLSNRRSLLHTLGQNVTLSTTAVVPEASMFLHEPFKDTSPYSGKAVCIWGTMPNVSTEQVERSLESTFGWASMWNEYVRWQSNGQQPVLPTERWANIARERTGERWNLFDVGKAHDVRWPGAAMEKGRHFIYLASSAGAHALARAVHRTRPLWALDLETQAMVLEQTRAKSRLGIRGRKAASQANVWREVWARVMY